MSIIEKMRQLLARWAESRRKKTQERRKREVQQEAARRIQLREFEGSAFLCFDNIPLLGADDLVDSLTGAVQEARFMYYKFYGDVPWRKTQNINN